MASNKQLEKGIGAVASWNADPHWTNPPQAFVYWWEPTRGQFHKPVLMENGTWEGGSIGGHRESRRAYPDRDGVIQWCGITAKIAWNCRRYRNEWSGKA